MPREEPFCEVNLERFDSYFRDFVLESGGGESPQREIDADGRDRDA